MPRYRVADRVSYANEDGTETHVMAGEYLDPAKISEDHLARLIQRGDVVDDDAEQLAGSEEVRADPRPTGGPGAPLRDEHDGALPDNPEDPPHQEHDHEHAPHAQPSVPAPTDPHNPDNPEHVESATPRPRKSR